MNSKSGTSFLLGRKATFYEFGIWTFFEHGADVEGSWVEGVLEQPTFSAQYSLLFFCRIALFLTAQYAQRFIFWSLGHQALYTWAPAYSLAELPSHDRVGLKHFVEGVLRGKTGALSAYDACRSRI